MNTIPVETLRTWLVEGCPVTILDVRSTTERVKWSIPGSLHTDAHHALKAHDPEALTSIELPDTKEPAASYRGFSPCR